MATALRRNTSAGNGQDACFATYAALRLTSRRVSFVPIGDIPHQAERRMAGPMEISALAPSARLFPAARAVDRAP
jgi:hypothetical protein